MAIVRVGDVLPIRQVATSVALRLVWQPRNGGDAFCRDTAAGLATKSARLAAGGHCVGSPIAAGPRHSVAVVPADVWSICRSRSHCTASAPAETTAIHVPASTNV